MKVALDMYSVFKAGADSTAQANDQIFSNCDLQNLRVSYAGQHFPSLPQNEDFSRNYYAKFYHDFLEVARCLGTWPGLSMQDYRDMYTIYAIDLSSQPSVSTTSQITITVNRRNVPADGNATLQNPRNIRGYFVYVSEAKLEIHCTKKTCRKI